MYFDMSFDPHVPIWTSAAPRFHSPDGVLQLSQGWEKFRIVEGTGNVTILEWKPREIRLRVASAGAILLVVKQFYYRGWMGQTPGEKGLLKVESSPLEGLVQVRVPPGEHQVRLTLNGGMMERAGAAITIACCALAGILVWRDRMRRSGACGAGKVTRAAAVQV